MAHRYEWPDGKWLTTELPMKEMLNRLNRLDTLRVLTEGYEEGEGYNICQKAWKAWNKQENFTGIIRLTNTEKDFLGYIRYENEYLDRDDIRCLDFYLK